MSNKDCKSCKKLESDRDKLLSALKGMTSMYGYCWDLVEGGLLCMPENVQRFEEAYENAMLLINKSHKENTID